MASNNKNQNSGAKPEETAQADAKANTSKEAPKKKEKTIKVKFTRQMNFGKVERNGRLFHGQKDEIKEVPYNKAYAPVVDRAVEDGFLEIVEE